MKKFNEIRYANFILCVDRKSFSREHKKFVKKRSKIHESINLYFPHNTAY